MSGGWEVARTSCWSREAVGHLIVGPDGRVFWSEPFRSRLRVRNPQKRRVRNLACDHICHFALSPKGQLAVYGARKAPPEAVRLPGFIQGAVAFVDEERLAVVCEGQLELRRGAERESILSFGRCGWARFLAVTAEQQLVFANQSQLALFCLKDGSRQALVNGFLGAVALSPDGREMVLSVGFELIRTRPGHWPPEVSRPGLDAGVVALAWADGRIVAADANGWIRLYCEQTMELLGQWRGGEELRQVAVVSGGVLAGGSRLHYYVLRPTPKRPTLAPLRLPARPAQTSSGQATPVKLCQYPRHSEVGMSRGCLAYLDGPRTVIVSQRASGRQRYRVDLEDEVDHLTLSADGQLLGVITRSGVQKRYHFFWRGRLQAQGLGFPDIHIRQGFVLVDRGHWAGLYQTGPWRLLQAWRPAPVRPSGEQDGQFVDRLPARLQARVSGDGRRIAIKHGLTHTFVVVWDVSSGRAVNTIEVDSRDFDLSHDGEYLLVAGLQGLQVFGAASGSLLQEGLGGEQLVSSPTAPRVALLRQDQVEILELPGLTLSAKIPCQTGWLRLAFDSAGDLSVQMRDRRELWQID